MTSLFFHCRKEDVQVLGISADSPFVLGEFRRTRNFKLPLLSGHSGEVATRYGANYEGDLTHMELGCATPKQLRMPVGSPTEVPFSVCSHEQIELSPLLQ